MNPSHQSSDRPVVSPLAELFTRYLQRQVAAQAQGLGFTEPGEEVTPYDAVPFQPVDPDLAFQGALEVRRYFPGVEQGTWSAPPDWPAVVATQEPAVSVAFCLGNFPQLVRDLQPLLTPGRTAVQGSVGRSAPLANLLEWARQAREPHTCLLAAGALRLARQFDQAGALLHQVTAAEWQAFRANEEAALAWHRRQLAEALQLWQAQPPCVPVLFNRGMAAWFLGQAASAADALSQAAAGLPETSPWHHLARLYLTLAEARP